VKPEMNKFLTWFNADFNIEPVMKSGIADLWFLTIHPFEDGNGRIARAISDMQLARSDTSEFRFYSISDQIEKNRKDYYQILERTQRGDLDITDWLDWYLNQLKASLEQSETILNQVVKKAEFWIENKDVVFNDRQIKIINKLFDGFEGKLNTSKYSKICKCSEDTALRDISELVKKRILKKGKAGGRSSYYYLEKMGDI
jgi:Fic family protein